VIGAVFLHRQRRLASPLVDLSLFRSAMFVTALAAMFASVFVIAGTDLFMAQYLQLVHDVSPFAAGLWLLPGVLGLIGGSMIAPQLARLMRPGLVVAGGLALAAVGLLVLAGLEEGSSLALLVSGMTLMGLGIGPVGALGTDMVVGAAPAERAGAASALSETATELGGALGIAILGAIGTAVYRTMLDDTLPRGLPSSVGEPARDTLGGAVEAARRLTEQRADDLLHAAREAFTQGLEIAALVGAAIGATMALLAALKLRAARVET